MFDSTLKSFKLTRDKSDTVSYRLKHIEDGLIDVSSYDVLHNSDIYRKFYFVPFGERKYKRNYPELNEVRRVLDYPYYFESVRINDIFTVEKNLLIPDKH
jgi:hypothetical protein